jgi:hypothetical protein
MFSTPAGPLRYKPTPTDGPELHVHPQRSRAIDATERWLVCLFLRRYVIWCARRRQIDRARNSLTTRCRLSSSSTTPALGRVVVIDLSNAVAMSYRAVPHGLMPADPNCGAE